MITKIQTFNAESISEKLAPFFLANFHFQSCVLLDIRLTKEGVDSTRCRWLTKILLESSFSFSIWSSRLIKWLLQAIYTLSPKFLKNFIKRIVQKLSFWEYQTFSTDCGHVIPIRKYYTCVCTYKLFSQVKELILCIF